MDHLAIMKKSWKLTEKILSGKKTVESRWYKNKYQPWNNIKSGETIYFKDSGEPVTIKATIKNVLQFDNLNEAKTKEIMKRYGKSDLGVNEASEEVKDYIKNKNYCMLIFFDDIKKIKPFEINKKGFGMMSSWITVDNIERLRA